jgi:hypothetical protein
MQVTILILSEKWSCPPWVITGEQPTESTRQAWYQRGIFYYNQIGIKAHEENERLKDLTSG